MEKREKHLIVSLHFLVVALYDRHGGPQDSCTHRESCFIRVFMCVVSKLSISSKSLSRVKLYIKK